jgi:hypothetical protein
MTKEEIGRAINADFPYVYAPTTAPTKLIFNDNTFIVGYFQHTDESKEFEKSNKFTFVEYGEKGEKYRATNDFTFITIVEGDKIKSVEYPSYGGALGDKLKALKKSNSEKSGDDWDVYRKNWTSAIGELEHTITEKYLHKYSEEKLMEFTYVPTKRVDPNIGEYLTFFVEITFPSINSKSIVLEPITGVTSEYNGKFEFYLRGNVYRNVTIYRKILDDKKNSWIIAKSYDKKTHTALTQSHIENLINEWLQ